MLRTFAILDEASSILRRSYELKEGPYYLSELINQGRELGIGLWVSSQEMSNLATSIIANSARKILVGGFGHGADYELFAKSILIDEPRMQFLKGNLQTGMACVSDPRHPEPFLIEIPFLPVNTHVPDEVVLERLKSVWPSLGATPPADWPRRQSSDSRTEAKSPDAKTPPREPPKPEVQPEKAAPPKDESPRAEKSLLNVDAERVLRDVYHYPCDVDKERTERLKIPGSRFQRIKKFLLSERLVFQHYLSGKGRPRSLLQINQKGLDLLSLPPKPLSGKGDFLHNSALHICAKKFSKTYRVQIEANIRGKLIDLVLEKDGKLTGVEVEMTEVHALENLLADLGENRVDTLIIAARDTKVLRRIEKRLNDSQEAASLQKKFRLITLAQLLDGEVPL